MEDSNGLVCGYRKIIHPFCGTTLTILSFSGNTTEQGDWFIITISGTTMICVIIFKRFMEMPSAPQMCLDAWVWYTLAHQRSQEWELTRNNLTLLHFLRELDLEHKAFILLRENFPPAWDTYGNNSIFSFSFSLSRCNTIWHFLSATHSIEIPLPGTVPPWGDACIFRSLVTKCSQWLLYCSQVKCCIACLLPVPAGAYSVWNKFVPREHWR